MQVVFSVSNSDPMSGFSFTAYSVYSYKNSVQDGPDGIALVDQDNNVLDFISWGQTITATEGAAAGMSSRLMGVRELGNSSAQNSLQLQGNGFIAGDFSWTGPIKATPAQINTGQIFVCPDPNASLAPTPVVQGTLGPALNTTAPTPVPDDIPSETTSPTPALVDESPSTPAEPAVVTVAPTPSLTDESPSTPAEPVVETIAPTPSLTDESPSTPAEPVAPAPTEIINSPSEPVAPAPTEIIDSPSEPVLETLAPTSTPVTDPPTLPLPPQPSCLVCP